MTHPPPSEHFGGKTVVEHLREARTKGALASAEIHGTEMPGHLAAASDAAKETAFALLILGILFSQFLSFNQTLLFLFLFCCGWILWKTARSALLGWARIERLHRVIEEERWEIEHHRQQEKIELTEMYRAKGLTGKLLDETIEVLMADDNRLLRVMLEEELGLSLEAYEHPLKQAAGALCGTLLSALLCLLGFWTLTFYGLLIAAAIAISIATWVSAEMERRRRFTAIVWNLALMGLTAGSVYFIIEIIKT